MAKQEYNECGVLVAVAYFWVSLAGCSSEFRFVFKYFQNLGNYILNILKEKLNISCFIVSFSWKPYKAFKTAQCKQPRSVEPWLNFDINFIQKFTGAALVQVKRASGRSFCNWKK